MLKPEVIYECRECGKEYPDYRPSACSCGGHTFDKIKED